MRVSCFAAISGLVDDTERRLRKKALKDLKNEKLYKKKPRLMKKEYLTKPRLMKKEYLTYHVR